MIFLNTALKNLMLESGGQTLAGAMNGGKIYVFGGPIPVDADTTATNAVLLAIITKGGDGATGLTFDPPANGVLPKSASEVWKCLGANVTAGTATFYRFCGPADTPTTAAGTPALCVQGTIGTNSSFDMALVNPDLVAGTDLGPFTSYEIGL